MRVGSLESLILKSVVDLALMSLASRRKRPPVSVFGKSLPDFAKDICKGRPTVVDHLEMLFN